MISTREFLGLDRSPNGHLRLPVSARTSTGTPPSLFGGVGLAAAILALEQAASLPVVWATGQYLARTGPAAVIDLDVELPAVGHSTTQGRIRGRLGDREIITVVGAAGRRQFLESSVPGRSPVATAPEHCPAVTGNRQGDSLHDHVDLRLARGMYGFTGEGTPSTDGHTLLWIRIPGVWHDAAALGLMADYMASAVGNALGRIVHCSSLDNTIRFATPVDPAAGDEWVLCDSRIEFVGNGFAHGTGLLWSMAGALLATASQSMTVAFPTIRSEPDLAHPAASGRA